jgi:hypothetical protein
VGLFGRFAYSEGRWRAGGPTAVPFLLLDVHDGGFATVDYRAADASGGRFYLGYEPRFYFAEPDAGDAVDVAAESQGFAEWLRVAEGTEVDPAAVGTLLASPEGAPPTDETVVLTVERLLDLAGLPHPEWPVDDDEPAG